MGEDECGKIYGVKGTDQEWSIGAELLGRIIGMDLDKGEKAHEAVEYCIHGDDVSIH